jgi:hypothetical protein
MYMGDMRSLCRVLGGTYNVYGRYEKFMQSFRWTYNVYGRYLKFMQSFRWDL